MNADAFADFRPGALSAVHNDEKMDQIRELLFGEYQRQSEARLALLEARIRELELTMHHRLDALQGRMEQLSAQVDSDHRGAFDDLARGLSELGERVRRLR